VAQVVSDPEDVVFRFLQINDTHYQTEALQPPPVNFQGANQRAEWLCEALRRGDFIPQVDFMLHVGDLVNTAYESEFVATKELMDRTGIPYHTTVGNHDNHNAEGDADKEAPYRQIIGDQFHYTFTHKGLGFVIANNSGSATAELTKQAIDERERNLRSHLESHADRPVIVACHIPVVPMRDEAILKSSFDIPTYKVAEPGMLRIIEEHRHHVTAVLCGHLHLSGVVQQNEINHIDVCGTAGYPHDIALHTVTRDELITEFIALPDELHDPSTNIHGKPYQEQDYTDPTHPDHDTYLRGRDDERIVRSALKLTLRS
jgi:predicted phosphodiesterase